MEQRARVAPMTFLRSSLFRGGVLAAIILTSVFVAESTFFAGFGLLVLFGIWYAIYLILVPRLRGTGGIVIVLLSMFVMIAAIDAIWVAGVSLLLFLQGNWLAFSSAARLDE